MPANFGELQDKWGREKRFMEDALHAIRSNEGDSNEELRDLDHEHSEAIGAYGGSNAQILKALTEAQIDEFDPETSIVFAGAHLMGGCTRRPELVKPYIHSMLDFNKECHKWVEKLQFHQATEGSGAADILVPDEHNYIIWPRQNLLIPTGIYVLYIPPKEDLLALPRSGFANKKNVIIPNSPGLIPSAYRGEIKVGLRNIGTIPRKIMNGDRICQLTSKVKHLSDYKIMYAKTAGFTGYMMDHYGTDRGEGGFGSTGR